MVMAENLPGSHRFPVPDDERSSSETWVDGLARLDDDQLRSKLGTISVQRQTELVLSLAWADRVRLIANSDQAGEIVKALPREEVFLTIKALGPESAHPMIALATPSQLRFILDIELWKRDSVDTDKAVEWLHHILACGEARVADFVGNADPELLAVILKRVLIIIPNEEDAVIPDGHPGIMTDEYFTVLSAINEETEAIALFLRIIRQASRDLFVRLLFLAHASVEEEAEEHALRWRNSRLEESGLLEFDEAIEIYGYIGEDEARRLGGSSRRHYDAEETPDTAAPAFSVLMVERQSFFYDVLRSIRDLPLANRLRREIVFCANRLLVADAEHIGELASMKKALTRLFSLVNVGLLFLAQGDKQGSMRVLKDVPLRDIFQVGFSRVADLRQAAQDVARRYWPKWKTDGFVFLSPPRDEIMRGLMMRVPQNYVLAGGETGHRDFETFAEVEAARAAVEEIGLVAEACFDRLGIPKPHEARPELQKVLATGLEDISLENLFTTGLVNLVVNGEFRTEPLLRRDVQGLFAKVLERDARGRNVVGSPSREKMLCWLAEATGFEGSKRRGMVGFLETCLGALEEEIGAVRAWEDVDPRFVRSLVFSRESGKG